MNFNPRTREGCDVVVIHDNLLRKRISIHAPVKGATYIASLLSIAFRYFNPRTREGCDCS